MEFDYAFNGHSSVENAGDRTSLSFQPDTNRTPTYFTGELRQGIAFREAISALHDVVVSDLRFKPKDRTAYLAWAAKQEGLDLDALMAQRAQAAARMKQIRDELTRIERDSALRKAPFQAAKRKYFDFLYQKDKEAWYVLDPVITVHPDEVFFECFSQDESTYGRLGTGFEVYKDVGDFACGTTNIDYSSKLYDEFQKIRSYKVTRFQVDPGGFTAKTQGQAAYREVKIDLPDSWVRGFLQVNSAMALPATRFELHPMDVHNFLFLLRRRKEKAGPRSLRYRLVPGKPVEVVFEPWNVTLKCPRSIYTGPGPQEIRVWGRRRLLILERLLPVAKRFTVHLLGTGLPSFYVADLGDMSFTLGLSGWTANDWATQGNFDLMAPRAQVDDFTKRAVFDALKTTWREPVDDLASRLKLDRALVLGALGAYCQAGRAMFDLNKGVYRVRELAKDPLPMDKLRFANEREQQAEDLLRVGGVSYQLTPSNTDASIELKGTVKNRIGSPQSVRIRLDADQRMVFGSCSCSFFVQNKLFKGPCEHMLALRMKHAQQTRA